MSAALACWQPADGFATGISTSAAQKLRLGIAATSVGFCRYAAHQKALPRQGIDLEIILMSLAAANNAFFKGEIEYSAGLTGLALAATRNYPAKILIFTIAKPLQSFVSRREIKEPRDLKGRRSPAARLAARRLFWPTKR
jgi:ABC-type nitrate/sulfonate/bicarbonate transport system substrate-binding protein